MRSSLTGVLVIATALVLGCGRENKSADSRTDLTTTGEVNWTSGFWGRVSDEKSLGEQLQVSLRDRVVRVDRIRSYRKGPDGKYKALQLKGRGDLKIAGDQGLIICRMRLVAGNLKIFKKSEDVFGVEAKVADVALVPSAMSSGDCEGILALDVALANAGNYLLEFEFSQKVKDGQVHIAYLPAGGALLQKWAPTVNGCMNFNGVFSDKEDAIDGREVEYLTDESCAEITMNVRFDSGSVSRSEIWDTDGETRVLLDDANQLIEVRRAFTKGFLQVLRLEIDKRTHNVIRYRLTWKFNEWGDLVLEQKVGMETKSSTFYRQYF